MACGPTPRTRCYTLNTSRTSCPPPPTPDLRASTGFEREMDAGMALMMQDMHAPGYSGNADIDFLAMMIPHHAGAVDMARLLLTYGRDPATRMLAEEIIAGQTIEIESMTRRLHTLRHPVAEATRAFPSLGGTRGP
ncbi:MAG: DUF305 domain-containing protein [Chitinophagaceae bacterium]|nr:DUF305 domain-containing protein [Rubrivivax sp.]